MSDLPGPADPRLLRASDADRERVADVLREAFAQGRISLGEHDERLGQVYSAKTYADLEAITKDLPESGADGALAASAARYPPDRIGGSPGGRLSLAILGSAKRRGPWVVPPKGVAATILGSVQLDLRQARFSELETTIRVYTILGGVEIIVPADVEVDVGGIGILAAFDHSANGAGVPGAPRLKVTGLALLGSVDVKRAPTELDQLPSGAAQ